MALRDIVSSAEASLSTSFTPSPPLRDDDPRLRWALFSYGVIADLVTHVFARGELSRAIREAAGRLYHLPGGGDGRFSERTLWTWLHEYRRGGIEALLPRRRSDVGKLRSLPVAALERAAAFRREDRTRSAALILELLEGEGRIERGSTSRQTIDRALRSLSLQRIPPGSTPARARGTVETSGPNELWIGDVHGSVLVALDAGGALRCHLSAFVDHYSRSIHGAYFPSPSVGALEAVLKRAIPLAGRPAIAYAAEGAISHRPTFALACDRIGIKLTQSASYEIEGRRIVAPFLASLALFERELVRRGARDLADVNQMFAAWLEECYHAAPVASLGLSPTELRRGHEPTFADPDLVAELLLLKVRRLVNRERSCIEVDGATFQVDPSLRGRIVRVRYDPHDLSSVVIQLDDLRFQRARRALPDCASGPRSAHDASTRGHDHLAQIAADHRSREATRAHDRASGLDSSEVAR